ncbi:MAG: permease prefix domain 1-containing protein [Vicinamibacterales bacterium]
MTLPSRIDRFLDALPPGTGGHPGNRRRLRDEVRDHLQTTAAALERDGCSRAEAEAEAIRRFGTIEQLAAAFTATTPARGASLEAMLRLGAAIAVNIVAITIVVRSLPDPTLSPVLAKLALLAGLALGTVLMVCRPHTQACTVSGVSLATVGVAVLSTYAEHGSTWPQFGSCFVVIAGLLVVQSGIGLFARPRNPLFIRT